MAGLPPSARLPSDLFLTSSSHSSPGSPSPHPAVPGSGLISSSLHPSHTVPAVRPAPPFNPAIAPFPTMPPNRMAYVNPQGYPAAAMQPVHLYPSSAYPSAYYNPYMPYGAGSGVPRAPAYRASSLAVPATSSTGIPSMGDSQSGALSDVRVVPHCTFCGLENAHF